MRIEAYGYGEAQAEMLKQLIIEQINKSKFPKEMANKISFVLIRSSSIMLIDGRNSPYVRLVDDNPTDEGITVMYWLVALLRPLGICIKTSHYPDTQEKK